MARKRKNKPQRVFSAKKEYARFITIFKLFFEACGDADAFNLLTEDDLRSYYCQRFRGTQLEISSRLSSFYCEAKSIKKDLNNLIHSALQSQKVSFVEGAPSISLDQFFRVGYSFGLSIAIESKKPFTPLELKLRERLPEFCEMFRLCFYRRHLEFLKMSTALYLNQIGYGSFSFDYDIRFPSIKGRLSHSVNPLIHATNYVVFKIDYYPPEKRYFVIRNHSRVAYRVASNRYYLGLRYATISSEQLKIKGETPRLYDIYIQSHAIDRMHERLGEIGLPAVNSCFIVSTEAPICTRRGDNFWLEVCFDGVRLGYWIGVIVEDVFLIRTFLFITCESTTEGRKLKELLGLSKYDVQYLKLDRLSSFVFSDFRENEQMVEILKQCSLDHLLSDRARDIFFTETEKEVKNISESILKYLSIEYECQYDEDAESIAEDQ